MAPSNGEPAGFQAEIAHQLYIFGIAIIKVVHDIAGVYGVGFACGVCEAVPYCRTAAALVHRTLHLLRGGSGAPEKPVRKGPFHRCGWRRCLCNGVLREGVGKRNGSGRYSGKASKRTTGHFLGHGTPSFLGHNDIGLRGLGQPQCVKLFSALGSRF